MKKYIKKIVSLLIVFTTLLATTITYTKSIQAEEDLPILAYAYRDDYEGGKLIPLYYVSSIESHAIDKYTIVLNQDIEITNPITVQSKWVIKMNGYKFYVNATSAKHNGYMFHLNRYASLTLLGEGDSKLPTDRDVTKTEFTYLGFRKDDSDTSTTKSEMKVTAGGLITGGYSTNYTGAIYMSAESTLNLTNVAVNGNGSDSEGASGAITVGGANCTINLNNSHVDHNYSSDDGGGINIQKNSSATINMNSSSIDYNSSRYYGGGIAAYGSIPLLIGNYTSSVSHNYAKIYAGGGIYLDDEAGDCNIKQIDISYNKTDSYGGGIDIESSGKVILDDCVIKGNTASAVGNTSSGTGGGIYVYNSNTIIRNCTITNNRTFYDSIRSKQTYAGGIFVYSYADVTLYGKNIIENNYNSKGKQDNVYLDNVSFYIHAYIKGKAYEGSHIGISCSSSSSQKLGINITDYIEGTYFSDSPDSLHLEYDSSSKELYQKEGASTKYSLTINGTEVSKYYSGDSVTIFDNNKDEEKIFLNWNTQSATGITIKTDQKEQSAFTISMPSNNVSVTADYLDRLTSLSLRTVDPKPTANRELPDWVQYTYGPDSQSKWASDIQWLEKNGDEYTPTSGGKAKYDTSYALKFQLPQNVSQGIAFSKNIKPEDITISFSDGTTIKAASVTLDEAGTITIISESITTESKVTTVTSFDEEYLTVQKGIDKDELINLLPSIAIGTDTDEGKADYEVDKDNIPDNTFDSLMEDGVVAKGGTITLPVKNKEGVVFADTAVFKVTVTVEEDIPEPTEEVAIPTISKESGSYTGTSLVIEATPTTEGSTIYYRIGNNEYTEYDSSTGIVLRTNEPNTVESFFVDVKAEKGDNSSDVLHLWYILDNRTSNNVTIKCTDTSIVTEGEEAWSETVTQSYTTGSKVVLYAPTYTGRAFEKWIYTNDDGEQVESTDLSIKFDSLDSDQEVQAIYNPVLSSVSINIPFPQANTDLAIKNQISVTGIIGNQTKDITAHFDLDHFTWLPNDTIADYETSYTAKLPITHTESIHYVLADNLLIMVNGDANPIYSVNIDKGYTNVYVTFPKTEDRPDEPEPSVEPTDEPEPSVKPTDEPAPTATPTATPETKKSTATPTSGWDDGGPFTTDKCGNVYDRWGNKIYEATGCNVGGYNLVQTDTK